MIDYRLGAHTGLELVREGFAALLYAPVIMLTGEATYEMDLEATALSAQDTRVLLETWSPSEIAALGSPT